MKKSRISQLGSLLVALTSAQGLLAPYTFAASSSETISTAVDSGRVISSTFDSLQITDQGSLTYTNGPALQISSGGNLGLLDNDGILYGSGSYALTSSGIIGTIDNSGLMSNANGYGAIYLDGNSRTDTLINSGTIGNTDETIFNGFSISSYGTLGTLKNTGTGLITGRLGVYNSGTIGVLENAGTIINANNDSNGIGVIYNTGTIDTLINSGTIASDNSDSDFGSNVAVRNYGTHSALVLSLEDASVVVTPTPEPAKETTPSTPVVTPGTPATPSTPETPAAPVVTPSTPVVTPTSPATPVESHHDWATIPGAVAALGTLTPFAQVSWMHQYDNRRMSSSATYAADTIGETQFTTKGASPERDMAGVAIGSTLYDANNLSLDARYDLQAGERYQAHTFSLRLRKSF